jgi:hypothetical protein
MRLSSSIGGNAADLTHPPTTQDSTGSVHNSCRGNQQLGKEDNHSQVQTHKVPREDLAIFLGHQLTMRNYQ